MSDSEAPPRPTAFDLRQHFLDLSRHVLTTGIQNGQVFDTAKLESALQVLSEAMQYADSGYRATAVSLGLRMLSESLRTPATHTPINPPKLNPHQNPKPQGPIADDLLPLQVTCPQCLALELVAQGGGHPLPVLCRNCGHRGFLS